MNADEYETWVETAREQTRQRMAEAQTRYGLGTFKRYQIDLPTATIRFYDENDAERVCADIQVAGSWAPEAESWLWGWDNESVPASASAQLAAVRDRGIREDIEQLRESFAPCDEAEAWSMASLAANVLDAQCVYRAPGAKNKLFLLLMAIHPRQ